MLVREREEADEMSSVSSWLGEIGCEQYSAVLVGSGYATVDSLR